MIVVGMVSAANLSSADALAIARRAAASGARTEVVGAVAADPAGDRQLIELAAAGVGHATILRTVREPEPADLDLALRYLPEIRVIILAGGGALVATAAAAAAWSGAHLVVVDDGPAPEDLPVVPLLLAPPTSDPDEAFAGFVAALAARLDSGLAIREAWDATVAGTAADRVAPEGPFPAGTAPRAPG